MACERWRLHNLVAYLVFWGWPLVVAALFMRLRLDLALILALVLGYMLLPQGMSFGISGVPPLTRNSIPAYSALVMCLAVQRSQPGFPAWQAAGWLPRSVPMLLLLVASVLSPILTALTNGDLQVLDGIVLRGLTLNDAGNLFYRTLPALVVFLLARRYLGSVEAQYRLLYVLVGAGLVYSLLMLVELRLSPMLHQWVYGVRTFQFVQQLRNDGYRPVVFLEHGLWTAIVLAMSAVAAAALWRVESGPRRRLLLAAAGWLSLVLLLANSLGALLIGMLMIPAALFFSAFHRALLAGILAATVLLYPMMRSTGYVPTTTVLNVLDDLGPQFRSASLRFRFENEDILLARANERPLFGWGGSRRNRVFDEQGRDVSITDGRWIILFGTYGWFGYITEFGLLCGPILLMFLRRRRLGDLGPSLGLALVLCANLVDLIPNGTSTPLTWLIGGAMLGRVEQAARSPAAAQAPPEARADRRPMVVAIGGLKRNPAGLDRIRMR